MKVEFELDVEQAEILIIAVAEGVNRSRAILGLLPGSQEAETRLLEAAEIFAGAMQESVMAEIDRAREKMASTASGKKKGGDR